MIIELVYATPEVQEIIKIRATQGENIKDILLKIDILDKYDLDMKTLKVGVFSFEVDINYILNDGDRIEIYRPLKISPIEARRYRAEKKRKAHKLKNFEA